MQMKYIIMKSAGIEAPILFHPILQHVDVVKDKSKVVSAGFCKLDKKDGSIEVSGFSQTLDLGNRPEDVEIIFRFMQMTRMGGG